MSKFTEWKVWTGYPEDEKEVLEEMGRTLAKLTERHDGENDVDSELYEALKAIAEMKINESTDCAQLSALCIAIAKTALAKVEKGE